MKVILLTDVPKLGQKYDIKNVADGYAKNFLIPKGLVELATLEKIKNIELKQEALNKEKQEQLETFRRQVLQLAGFKPEFSLRVGEDGSVFGAISENEISEWLKEKGINIEPDKIQLKKHLKDLGEHIIKIKFSPEIEAELKLIIKAEEKEKAVRLARTKKVKSVK